MVAEAKRLGLQAVGITDHDTITGIAPALAAGKNFEIEVVPGLELSTEWEEKEYHLLGYYFNEEHPLLQEKLATLQAARLRRAEKIVEKLNGLGYPVAWERVLELAGEGAVGRPHIALALMEKGYIKTVTEGFEKLFGRGGPAYVPRFRITPVEAVNLIKEIEGVPVLAHAGIPPADEILAGLVAVGLKGLEVYYPEHTKAQVSHYFSLAQKYNLLVTGGSDFHGFGPQGRASLGACRVPYRTVVQIKQLKT